MQRAGNPCLLFVDNDEDTRSMITVMLKLYGIDVTTAATVTEASILAGTAHFDLYLLATRFPDGDGFDLCRLLRSRAPEMPILFYSGDARDADRQKGLTAGADFYLTKPCITEVTDTVLSVLNLAISALDGGDETLCGAKPDDAQTMP